MNMHNILASICTPMTWSWRKFNYVKMDYDALKHEEYAEDLKLADFRHGYYAMVFFYSLLINSTADTPDFLKIQTDMRRVNKKRVQQLKKALPIIGDGSIMQSK